VLGRGKAETVDDFEVDGVVQRALDRLTLLAEATTALSSTLTRERD
jgi:16S rRNA G527 N7-methylase RsmG